MKKISLLILYCLFWNLACQAPSGPTSSSTTNTSKTSSAKIVTLSDYFIKSYQGSIQTQGDCQMVLYNDTEGNLSGYAFKEGNTQKISLEGQIDLNESFILTARDTEGKELGKFVGDISNPAQLTGFWKVEGTQEEAAFDLKASTPQGSQSWTGAWHYNDIWNGGLLVIGNVTSDGFDFVLDFSRNGDLGFLFDRAQWQGTTANYTSQNFDPQDACRLNFQKQKEGIKLAQASASFACGFGLKANASGLYETTLVQKEASFAKGSQADIFQNDQQHDQFKKLVKNYYGEIADDFQQWDAKPIEAGDLASAKAFAGFVIGQAELEASIVMYTPEGNFWIASLGDDGSKETRLIRYFTTEANTKNDVPATIKKWAIRFGPYVLIRE